MTGETPLRKARNSRGLRLCDLAIVAGVDYSRLSGMEAGYQRPSYSAAQRLAAALGSTVETLFPGQRLVGAPQPQEVGK